jgi:hypothetical protein
MLEHHPGERASASGLYNEINIFGTPTGPSVSAERGEQLPHGPFGFGWRFTGENKTATNVAAQAALVWPATRARAQPAATPHRSAFSRSTGRPQLG